MLEKLKRNQFQRRITFIHFMHVNGQQEIIISMRVKQVRSKKSKLKNADSDICCWCSIFAGIRCPAVTPLTQGVKEENNFSYFFYPVA
jgi:hypothetical protein